MEFSGQYLTYNEYKGLGGTLPEMPFNLLEFRARKEIDKYTFGRLKNLSVQIQDVKLCVKELIVELNSFKTKEDENKGIISENTNGYSVTYESVSKELTQAQNSSLKAIIYSYLSNCKLTDNTPYLYRG